MPLSDLEIRSAKASDKDKKLFDGGGLYLLVTKTGSKLWKLKYRIHGKEKKLSLGAYPLVSLKDARLMRDEAKRQLQDGQDPSEIKRAEKQDAKLSSEQTFGLIAQDYLDYLKKDGRAEATLKKEQWLARQLLPALGTRPIKEITSRELLVILKKPEKAGKRETARRLRSFASRVFRHGIPEYCEVDPTVFLKGKLASPETKHHAAITNAVDLGKLLRAIDGYNGEPATAVALKLTPHVFQRPGEVRSMRWAEIDFEQAVWSIPAARMKQRKTHHVPLSRQSLALIEEMRTLVGKSEYVFPSVRTWQRPMSENTINGCLRRLGYSGSEMTAHGFRTTASSLLNESGKWNPDAIERALSHTDKNQIRGTYNRSPYWAERVEMAQWWSDYLDTLRTGADIIPLYRKSGE